MFFSRGFAAFFGSSPPEAKMLSWVAAWAGVVPPRAMASSSLAVPTTPLGPNASKNPAWADTPGWPAGCPKYAAWAEHQMEQLRAQLTAQLKLFAQLKSDSERLQRDANFYYRTGSTKQLAVSCDPSQSQPGNVSSANAPPVQPTNASSQPSSRVSVPTHTVSSDCPTPHLPPGSHCILIVAEAPDNVEMGMANRMHRMADALVSIGVRRCRHWHHRHLHCTMWGWGGAATCLCALT